MERSEGGVVCSACGRPLAAGEARYIVRPILWLAAVAFAFMHAGNWIFRFLGGPHCPYCRIKVSAAAFLVSAAILAVAAWAIKAWLALVFAVAK